MITLPYSSTDKLQLVTAQNGAKCIVAYNDDAGTGAYSGGSQKTAIASATTTDICATPAASTVREVHTASIKNTYAGAHVMTVQQVSGGTAYELLTVTLLEDESLHYAHGAGWTALDANGNVKRSASSIAIALGKTLTIGNTLELLGTDGVTVTFPGSDIVVAGSAAALTSGRMPRATTGGLLIDDANSPTCDASGNVVFAGDVTVTGSLTVNGTVTTVNTTNLAVTDALIKLATGNAVDTLDIGLYGVRQPAATPLYTGLFRDATDGKYKLFDSLEAEPTTTVNTGGTGYAAASLVVGALECSTVTASGILATTDATDATSATAASLKTAGGIASVKSAWIGANLTVVTGAGNIGWGSYTPTITAITNVAASTTREIYYTRNGETVTVSGQLDIDPTSTGVTEAQIDLPIASNLATAFELSGSGTAFGSADGVSIRGDPATDKARIYWSATSSANQVITFIFSYKVN